MTKEQLEAQNKELKKENAAIREKLACVNAEADKCHAVMQDLYKRNSADVYGRAVTYYGESSRLLLTIEEMSELIKELCKELRDRGNIENIAEEVADVEITLSQIKMIYDIEDAVSKQRDYKLNRFANRMIELKKTGAK